MLLLPPLLLLPRGDVDERALRHAHRHRQRVPHGHVPRQPRAVELGARLVGGARVRHLHRGLHRAVGRGRDGDLGHGAKRRKQRADVVGRRAERGLPDVGMGRQGTWVARARVWVLMCVR
jgi:hypothetical protein